MKITTSQLNTTITDVLLNAKGKISFLTLN